MDIIISDKDKLIQDLYKKMTKVTDIYSTTHKVVHWGDVQAIVEKFFMDKNSDWLMAKTEPQTDCGDFADRLAYERGVKHAWEVAQKVFVSTVTFYEAEDVAKQIDKDINVRSKDEPQTCSTCRFDDRYGDESICKECAKHYSDQYAPIEDEPQTDCAWK